MRAQPSFRRVAGHADPRLPQVPSFYELNEQGINYKQTPRTGVDSLKVVNKLDF